MLRTSIRVSYCVVLSSLVSVALVILLEVAARQRQQQESTITPQLLAGTTHGAIMYRAHEVGAEKGRAGSKGWKKFLLQEGTESGEPPGLSWRNLSVKEVAGLWKAGGEFVDTFTSSIKDVGFDALFFESVPVTKSTMDKPYEYVMTDSPSLASVSADGHPFAEHIAAGEGTNDVVSFRNLRKDARLVVPCKGEDKPSVNYAHLAAFVRTAPREQVRQFFGAVGKGLEEEVASRSDESPVWLSTSGLGVYWLHARLDSIPKYYTYTPYKTV